MSRLAFLLCCAFVVAGTFAADVEIAHSSPVSLLGTQNVNQGEKVALKAERHQTLEEQVPVDQSQKPEQTAKTEENIPRTEKTPSTEIITTPDDKKPSITTISSSTETTTSSAPRTTTTAPVTSTVAPTPVPPPSQGKWIVNSTGKVCIIIQMAAQFNISYNTTENKKAYTLFDLPTINGSTKALGVCGAEEQNVTLTWMTNRNQSQDNFTLHFVKNETTSHYSLHHMELQLPASAFPNANFSASVLLIHEQPSFATALSNSYRCIKQQKLDLKGSNNVTGHITVSDLQFQAFRSDNNTTFALAKDCAFDVPDVVPIAVGCALAGLVVIVLIAYLVSRRRSQARGYLSM